jgi:hypothetical protein
MLHLWKHPQSGIFYFRRTVPEEQRPAVGKREIKFTLKTTDLKEANLRYPDAAARANEILQRAAGGQRHLTHGISPIRRFWPLLGNGTAAS